MISFLRSIFGHRPFAFRYRRVLFAVVKVCVAGGLLAWLFSSGKIDLGSLLTVKNAIPEYLSAFVLLGAGWFIQVYRWKRLSHAQGIRFLFSEACRMTWASQFCSLFLPGAVGGELVRGYYVAVENPKQRLIAVSTVIMDRGLGLYTSLWLGIASSLFFFLTTDGVVSRQVITIGLLLVIILCCIHLAWQLVYSNRSLGFIKKVIPKRYLKRVDETALPQKPDSRELLLGAGLSFAANTFSILSFYMIGRVFAPESGCLEYFIACPVVFISLALPVSPGGIGVGETAAEFLFNAVGVPNGATMMVMYRIINIVFKLPGALFLVISRKREKSSRRENCI